MKKLLKLRRMLAILVLAGMLGGCREGIPIVSEVKENKGYTLAQSMLVVTTERNHYQELYTSNVWNVAVDHQGTTFQAYLLGEIRSFLQELKTMNMLAESEGITLSGQEKERLTELSKQYYEGLSSDDIAYMKIKEDDVYEMYSQYYIANKLVSELTKDVNVEISDSEAKIIQIQQIELTDKAAADDVYEQVTAEGADFTVIARSRTEGAQVSVKLGRSERPGTFEDQVFALEQDQISPVFAADGKYYIVKCTNAYDEPATQERKTQLTKLRRNQAFRQIYDQFVAEKQITFDEPVWESMTFSAEDATTTTNFFELYHENITN